ncbi:MULTISPECIES: hypothetical protein [Alphaproteobacteria]|uniref:hypothetical protein n=1 Tax=Alphaproteobacteria TaxID=28211 RepID=UPI003264DC0A
MDSATLKTVHTASHFGGIRPMIAIRLIALIMLLAGISVTQSASAQALFGGRNMATELITIEDLEIQNKVGLELLNSGKEGDSAEWSNPQTKSHGTITLRDAFEYNGMKCRRAEMETTPKGLTTHTVWYKHGVCAVPGEGWKYLY